MTTDTTEKMMYWTSEDDSASIDMSGCSPEDALRMLLEQCADEEQRRAIMAGNIDGVSCHEINPHA